MATFAQEQMRAFGLAVQAVNYQSAFVAAPEQSPGETAAEDQLIELVSEITSYPDLAGAVLAWLAMMVVQNSDQSQVQAWVDHCGSQLREMLRDDDE